MPNASVDIDTQGGAVVTGTITTGGGDLIQRDKIVGGDDVRGDKYVTVLGAERPLLYVGVPPMPPIAFTLIQWILPGRMETATLPGRPRSSFAAGAAG
ncbi:MAG: hypothetical protein R3E79_16805 [Caldilineaceae bacterium]